MSDKKDSPIKNRCSVCGCMRTLDQFRTHKDGHLYKSCTKCIIRQRAKAPYKVHIPVKVFDAFPQEMRVMLSQYFSGSTKVRNVDVNI